MSNIIDYSLKVLGGLVAIAIPVLNLYRENGRINRKNKLRKNIADLIKESSSIVEDDEFISSLKEAYKEAVLSEIVGVNIKPESYKILHSTPEIKDYTSRTIRLIWSYIHFEEGKLSIKIGIGDYIAACYVFVAPIITTIMFTIILANDKLSKQEPWIFGGGIIVFVCLWLYTFVTIVVPLIWALQLKRKLKTTKQ